uniref:FLYWCH-type domain-containing protein n=1 Tax=Panagrolaimus sp. PS1159 TaxID=55785 RepID=A0AC35FTI0_9BILA
MAQFFRSQRGRPKLGHEGYIYQCQRETEHEILWRCEAREKKEKCPAKAKSMGNIVTILKAHNHPPDYANVEKEILKRNIIDNAAAQGLSTTSDLTGIISSLPNTLASKMPTLDCMKRAIRRRQNVAAQSNRSTAPTFEGLLPTSTGTDYYSSISENATATAGSMDIFINSQNQLFDAK